jgi:hypothetical protein
MNSTRSPKPIESDDVLVACVQQLAKLEYDAARQPGDEPQPPRNEVRPPVPSDRPPREKSLLRGFIGLLLAACIGVAAMAWQSSYGHAAKLMIAQWAPQFVPISSLPLKKTGLPPQPSPSTIQLAAAEPSSSRAAPQAPTAPQNAAQVATPVSPELARLLQTMRSDLATVLQGIEQIKTSQQQLARDNAKVAEPNLRPKTSGLRPRSVSSQTPVSSTPPASPRRGPPDDGPDKRTTSRKPARVIAVDHDLFLEDEDGGWRPCPACSIR